MESRKWKVDGGLRKAWEKNIGRRKAGVEAIGSRYAPRPPSASTDETVGVAQSVVKAIEGRRPPPAGG